MKYPLVSVIIPLYNAELYITDCINSIVSQDYANIEILVINDGSKDVSVKKVEEISDARIKIINTENEGVSAARNTGVKLAIGKYIYFIDSDDWIERNLISSCVALMEEQHLDIMYFNYFVDSFAENGELIRTEKSKLSQIVEQDQQILEIVGYTWNKLYRKSFIDLHHLSFRKELKMHEDVNFNLMCFSKTHKVLFIDKCFYHYNNRVTESLIKSYNPNNVTSFNVVQETLGNYLREKKYTEETRLKILSIYTMNSLRYQVNAVFQFSNFSFMSRTVVLKTLLKEFENRNYLKFYQVTSVKELVIKKLALYNYSLPLNIILSLKK